VGEVVDINTNIVQDSLDELEKFFMLAKEGIESGELLYFGGVFEDDQGNGSLCLTVGKESRIKAANSFCAFSCSILEDILEVEDEQNTETTH
jgi:hypothetical protein